MDKDKKLGQVWKTYSARFNASNRLQTESVYELWIPALLSVYILAMNTLQLLPGFNLTTEKQAYITLFTICLSLLLVVISLIWGSADTKLKSKNYHDCALEMKGLYDHLEFVAHNQDDEIFHKEYAKYSDLEKKFSLNHDYLDYKIIEIRYSTGIKKYTSFCAYFIRYYFKYYMVKHLIVIVPLIIGILIITR